MTLLPMENKESILCALKSFEKDRPSTIPPILEDYIKQIARDGRTMLPWIYIKPLLLHKFNKVIDGFVAESTVPDFLPLSSSMTEIRQQVYNTLKRLDGIPFTIQRICEMLENPFRHYSRPDKYLRGMEKVCTVVSTVDPEGNKIYREDPRFPSRAGLDEFSPLTSDRLLLSPPSPCVDDLHRPQTSKSSDIDVITDDDDENEDDDDDADEEDGTESSSHGSCTPPPRGVSSSPTPQPSALVAPCDSGSSWPFGSSRLTLSPVLKSQFRDLTPERSSAVENTPTDFAYQRVSGIVSQSALEQPVPESPSGKEHIDGEHSSSIFVSPTSAPADEGRHATRSPTNGFSPPAATPLSFSESCPSTTNITQASIESGPSVAVVLRPIGQLEAFVQNVVGADDSYAISPSGLPARLPAGSIFSSSLEPNDHSSAIANSKDHGDGVALPDTDRILTRVTKRHAPPVCDDVVDEPADRVTAAADTTLSPPEHHQSPAKRRRLSELLPTSPDCDVRASVDASPSIALNDSPPIILCVPSSQNRDEESGESTCLTRESIETMDTMNPTGAENVASANSYEHGNGRLSSSEASSEVAHLHTRINSETGEVEEQN